MSWYNLTSCDYSDFFNLTSCANQVSNYVFMPIMLLTIFLISLIGMSFANKSFFRGLTFSGFICSILSIFLVLMNMLNVNFMYLCFFLTGGGIIGVILSEALS